MTAAQLNIAEKIISDYQQIRTKSFLKFEEFNTKTIRSFVSVFQQHNHNTITGVNEFLTEYPVIAERARNVNRNTGAGFNALRFFDIGETMHSQLIVHLLNSFADHGQGNLFLEKFLKLIEIESPEKGHWIVTAETGRIDILLKRNEPHSVIVIENKSNWAGDQLNQLYRYWHQEIYAANPHLAYDYAENARERYRMIYMPPNGGKIPEQHSLARPVYLKDPLPFTLPMKVEILSFSEFVVNWLESSITDIPSQNFRLKEYIKQYIELWKF